MTGQAIAMPAAIGRARTMTLRLVWAPVRRAPSAAVPAGAAAVPQRRRCARPRAGDISPRRAAAGLDPDRGVQRGSLAGARADQHLPRPLAPVGGAQQAPSTTARSSRATATTPSRRSIARSMVRQALERCRRAAARSWCSTSSKGRRSGDRRDARRDPGHGALAPVDRPAGDGRGARRYRARK